MSPAEFVATARAGYVAPLVSWLEMPFDPNAVEPFLTFTGLHAAAQAGHKDIVGCLLACGAELEAVDRDGKTPLLVAAGEGHADVVRALLEAGADKEATNHSGETPLLLAALSGCLPSVLRLLEARARVDRADSQGRTPLLCAAQAGHQDIVRCLLERDAPTEAVTKLGSTPLLAAARRGHEAVVRSLVEAGADKDKGNDEGKHKPHACCGFTALCVAADLGQDLCVPHLQSKRIDLWTFRITSSHHCAYVWQRIWE